MTSESLSSDPVATPKTNAAARYLKNEHGDWVDSVPVDFARAQERRIAHLELALNQIKNGCVDEGDTVNEWYRSAPPEIRRICIAALEGKPL